MKYGIILLAWALLCNILWAHGEVLRVTATNLDSIFADHDLVILQFCTRCMSACGFHRRQVPVSSPITIPHRASTRPCLDQYCRGCAPPTHERFQGATRRSPMLDFVQPRVPMFQVKQNREGLRSNLPNFLNSSISSILPRRGSSRSSFTFAPVGS